MASADGERKLLVHSGQVFCPGDCLGTATVSPDFFFCPEKICTLSVSHKNFLSIELITCFWHMQKQRRRSVTFFSIQR